MIEREVVVCNELGLHARPAAQLVKLSAKYQAEVELVRDDLVINARSIMGVMMLAAECGATIRIRANGVDAEEAVAALAALVEDGFGEQ